MIETNLIIYFHYKNVVYNLLINIKFMARDRNLDWRYREKRWDTHIWTIEEKYNLDLWVRSDMELDNYLNREWYSSLSQMLKDK